MNPVEQLQHIVQTPNLDLLNFFNALQADEQLSLKDELKTQYLYLKTHPKLGNATTENDLKKIDQVQLCAMHVYSFDTFMSNFHMVPRRYFDLRLYQKYAPDWLPEYLKNGHLRMHVTEMYRYAMLADLEVMFGFQAPPDILSERLVSVKTRQVLMYCEQFPVLLERHIWLLFSEHAVRGFMRNEAAHWLKTFDTLIAEGKIDRMALLTHAVNALQCHRGVGEQTGWTLKLLKYLSPTVDELKTLQPQMIALLPLSQTIISSIARADIRAQLMVLTHCHKLLDEGKLDIDALLKAHPKTMKQRHEAVLLNLLGLYDAIIEQSPSHKTTVLACVSNMLSNDSLEIKQRAKTLIEQYGDNKMVEQLKEKTAMADSVPEQFKQHLHDPDLDLLNFFLSLTLKEQKSLKNLLMQAYRSLKPAVAKTQNSLYEINKQQQLMVCAMKVLGRWDYIETYQALPKGYFNKSIHKKFRPKWLQTELNNDEHIMNLKYDDIASFPAYPDCVMQPRAIVHYFIETFIYWGRDNLQQRTDFFDLPVCLDEHIWYIFAEPCRIETADSDYEGAWTTLFIELADSGRIPRDKLLKECLQSANRNLPQKQTGWCFRLFNVLEPSETELHALQNDLLQTLNCTYSKPVNDALKNLKAIAKDLDINEFVGLSVTPLSSTIKAVVTNTLAVFEQLAKAHKNEHDPLSELCQAITTALLFSDEKVQARVAKFLVKYGNTSDELLSIALSEYLPEVYSSVKTLLTPFADNSAEEDVGKLTTENTLLESVSLVVPVAKIRDDNAIAIPDNFDDRVFFLAQAFENNEPWHFDVYLQVMIDIAKELTSDNINHLSPVIKSANSLRNTGMLQWFMAGHFNRCMQGFFYRFPDFSESFKAKNTDNYEFITHLREDNVTAVRTPSHIIFNSLLNWSHAILVEQLNTPVLSTPTHTPCFIDFNTLVSRLMYYQTQNVSVHNTDFQIALSRVQWGENSIVTGLTGEYADLLNYLLGNQPLDYAKCQTVHHWLTAIYRKTNVGKLSGKSSDELKNFIAQFELDADYLLTAPTWDYQHYLSNKHTNMFSQYGASKVHAVDDIHQRSIPNLDYTAFDTIMRYPPICPEQYLVADTMLNWHSHSYRNDMPQLLMTTPHSPNYALLAILQSQFNEANNLAEQERILINTLPTLIAIWDNTTMQPIAYQYFALGMTFVKKAVTQLTGELWLQAVSEQKMDSAKLGKILGEYHQNGIAPMKRLTDLVSAQLINISTHHNREMITLISHMIAKMGDDPVKGTKKLLEIYLELLTVIKESVPETTRKKLKKWGKNNTVKVMVKKLVVL